MRCQNICVRASCRLHVKWYHVKLDHVKMDGTRRRVWGRATSCGASTHPQQSLYEHTCNV